MIINAELHCKADEFEPKRCEIIKIIELPRHEFMSFMENPTKYSDLITENKNLMREKNGVNQCLLALCEGSEDGILLQAEGYDYARYSTFLPNARQIANAQHYQCLRDLEKHLLKAGDEMVSRAIACDSEEPYRANISDIINEHRLNEALVPLFIEMLGDRFGAFEFRADGDAIIIDMGGQEQDHSHAREEAVSDTKPLPFTPERMEQLLDKALDCIGGMSSDSGLYDKLQNIVGMTDDEIAAAGFGWLKKHFNGQAESEGHSMRMT